MKGQTMGYTVEIQAGNADGTVWQAMQPAGNVTDIGSPEQVAYDAIANEDINVLDDNGPWRVCVWTGFDADTSADPAYIIDDQQFHDQQADMLDAWEAARVGA